MKSVKDGPIRVGRDRWNSNGASTTLAGTSESIFAPVSRFPTMIRVSKNLVSVVVSVKGGVKPGHWGGVKNWPEDRCEVVGKSGRRGAGA
jgi:hypothetical protein